MALSIVRSAAELRRTLPEVAAGSRGGRTMEALRPDAVRALVEAGFSAPDHLDLRDAGTLAPLDRLDSARPG